MNIQVNQVKEVAIPHRRNGFLEFVKTIKVEWACPVCGKVMGEPVKRRFCEDGWWYEVDCWENDCGHVARYRDLKIVGKG